MMFRLLQITTINQTPPEVAEAMKKAWDIAPGTVYGFLLAIMLLAIFAMIYATVFVTKKYIALVEKTAGALDSVTESNQRVLDKLDEWAAQMPRAAERKKQNSPQ